jgi:hypothetical protein
MGYPRAGLALLLAAGWLVPGCGSRPAEPVPDLASPVDVVEALDVPSDGPADAVVRRRAPDGAAICPDVLTPPPPMTVACDDGSGLHDCCPNPFAPYGACDPCTLPTCYAGCWHGSRRVLQCEFGAEGWVLVVIGENVASPCTADGQPILFDGGPVIVAQQACNDGTGRTDCCPPGTALDVACTPGSAGQPQVCHTPCQAASSLQFVCGMTPGTPSAYFMSANSDACGPDGGP